MTAGWLMSAPCAVPRTPRGGFAGPAFFLSCRPQREVIAGHVMPVLPQPNPCSSQPPEARQAEQERRLAHRRAELIRELAQRRKAHRATCSVTADLREATHALLAMGER